MDLQFVEKGLVNGSAKRRRRAIWTDIADTSDPVGKLRSCRHWPRHGRAADERYELAPIHSITSSTLASSCGGTSRPSALAVCRLTTNSNFVDCNTGSSAGLAPLMMLPV